MPSFFARSTVDNCLSVFFVSFSAFVFSSFAISTSPRLCHCSLCAAMTRTTNEPASPTYPHTSPFPPCLPFRNHNYLPKVFNCFPMCQCLPTLRRIHEIYRWFFCSCRSLTGISLSPSLFLSLFHCRCIWTRIDFEVRIYA